MTKSPKLPDTNKHCDYLDFINVIAMISVLILHTNGCFWGFSSTEMYWKTANIIECVFYPAVPLFFMISGITLMDFYERYSLKDYFLKRIKKTLIPFLAWSLLGCLKGLIAHPELIDQVNIRYIYQGITGTGFVKIFWFFTSLFCIYLSMPLFSAVDPQKRKEVFLYLTITGFVLNTLIPFVNSVFSLGLNTPYKVTAVTDVLFWVPLGWLLVNCKISGIKKALLYFFAVIGLLMHIMGTYVLSMRAGMIVETYKGYQNVPCILYSAGVFVLLKEVGTKIMAGRCKGFFSTISGYSFAVYLMQFVFLETLPHFFDTHSILYRLGMPFVIIPIIMLITWCMRKIPVIRIIVP